MTEGGSQTLSPVEKVFKRDADFYFEGRYLIFEVEGCLFRVPSRKMAEESAWCRDIMELPMHSTEGDSDENPIRVPQVKAAVFRNALYWMFKNRNFKRAEDQMEELFRFSRTFQFEQLEKHCLKCLEISSWLNPVDQLRLCQEFDLPYSWACSAFIQLCDRKTPFTVAEAEQLNDWRLFVIIAFVRESHLKAKAQITSRHQLGVPGNQVTFVEWRSPRSEEVKAWILEAEGRI
ncbi:hypothetical protein DL96DRAFT_1613415 [Flagelloscypha sp. PMI_526]|nr:hypothetical protein DL96DRAFT_1613415 [Flagelloscypha sp. PMI_526]